jgi:protein-disulfide isomerase
VAAPQKGAFKVTRLSSWPRLIGPPFNREFLVRACLVAVFVVVSHELSWEWLRFVTSEAVLCLSALLGMETARLSFDTIRVQETQVRFDVGCTFVDVFLGSLPLLWELRRSVLRNFSRLVVVGTILFAFNVLRLEIAQVLYAHGVSWEVADGFVGGISYFLVWVVIWQLRTWHILEAFSQRAADATGRTSAVKSLVQQGELAKNRETSGKTLSTFLNKGALLRMQAGISQVAAQLWLLRGVTRRWSMMKTHVKNFAVAVIIGMATIAVGEILTELRAIHHLLERMERQQMATAQTATLPAPDKVQMTVAEGWYSIGRDDAPVTIVEFADYQCPFCRKFQSEAFVELRKNDIDTGKVRFVSRDLPLDFHPNASGAAMAARCAGEQHKFWQMRDLLLAKDADLSSAALLKYGKQINLDITAFEFCLNDKKYTSNIQKDVADAASIGIGGTPSFVVGKTAKDQINGVRISGAAPYSAFETAIKNQLNPNE